MPFCLPDQEARTHKIYYFECDCVVFQRNHTDDVELHSACTLGVESRARII